MDFLRFIIFFLSYSLWWGQKAIKKLIRETCQSTNLRMTWCSIRSAYSERLSSISDQIYLGAESVPELVDQLAKGVCQFNGSRVLLNHVG